MMPIMAQDRKYDPFTDCVAELEEAKHGRITPEEAERQAMDRGLGPLAVPLKEFPLDHPRLAVWTTEMTAAWIQWKEPARVLRHYEPSYAQARLWVQNTCPFPPQRVPVFQKREGIRFGHDLKVFGPTNVRDDFLDIDGKSTSLDRERNWWEKLSKELVAGRIHASGELCVDEWAEEKGFNEDRSVLEQGRLKLLMDFTTAPRGTGCGIPPALWRHLSMNVSRGETVLRYQNAVLFRSLRFDGEEVMGRFPANITNVDEHGRAHLVWRYREPSTVRGKMSVAVAAMIRATHIQGFPRTTPMIAEVLRIIEECDVDNTWKFDDKSDDACDKFVRRLMEKLLDDEYSAQLGG